MDLTAITQVSAWKCKEHFYSKDSFMQHVINGQKHFNWFDKMPTSPTPKLRLIMSDHVTSNPCHAMEFGCFITWHEMFSYTIIIPLEGPVIISRSGRACVRHASADMKTIAWLWFGLIIKTDFIHLGTCQSLHGGVSLPKRYLTFSSSLEG